MFNRKIEILIKEYHIKQIALIELIGSNKVSFAKKRKDNSFTEREKSIINNKYGALLH